MKTKVARGQSWRYEVVIDYKNGSGQVMGRRTRFAFGRLLTRLVLDPNVAVIGMPVLMPKVDTLTEDGKENQ